MFKFFLLYKMSACGMPKGGAKKHVPLDDGGGPVLDDANDFNPANMGGRRRRTKKVHKKRRSKGGAYKVIKHTDNKYYIVNLNKPEFNPRNGYTNEVDAEHALERLTIQQLKSKNYEHGIPDDTNTPVGRKIISNSAKIRINEAANQFRKEQQDNNQEKSKPKAVKLTEKVDYAEKGGRRITRRAHWRYIRGMKIRVPAKKVKDMGAKGKWASLHGPGIGELKPGGLMGYSPSMSKTARHKKLSKVVKSKGALSTFRKLNALSTYTKRTAKGKSKTAKADRNWVKKTYM